MVDEVRPQLVVGELGDERVHRVLRHRNVRIVLADATELDQIGHKVLARHGVGVAGHDDHLLVGYVHIVGARGRGGARSHAAG